MSWAKKQKHPLDKVLMKPQIFLGSALLDSKELAGWKKPKYLQKKQEGASFYHSGLRPPLKKTSPLLFYRKYLGFFHPARKGKSGILSFVSNLNERM